MSDIFSCSTGLWSRLLATQWQAGVNVHLAREA